MKFVVRLHKSHFFEVPTLAARHISVSFEVQHHKALLFLVHFRLPIRAVKSTSVDSMSSSVTQVVSLSFIHAYLVLLESFLHRALDSLLAYCPIDF